MSLTLGDIANIICERVTMEDVCELYGFEIRRNFISCPFHTEKTASLHINHKFWKCFGCGAGGNVIQFVEKLFNLNFRDTVIKLDNEFGLGLTNQKVSKQIKDKAKELQRRRKQQEKERQAKERYIKELQDRYLTAWKYSLIYAPFPERPGWNINTDPYVVDQYLKNIDSRFLQAKTDLAQLEDYAEFYGFKIERWEAELMFLK